VVDVVGVVEVAEEDVVVMVVVAVAGATAVVALVALVTAVAAVVAEDIMAACVGPLQILPQWAARWDAGRESTWRPAALRVPTPPRPDPT